MNFLRREIPGFQAAYISQVAPEVQFRETRRIVCDYSLSDEDVLRGTRFDDTVALASYPSEVHPPETGQRMWGIPERYYQVPYRIFHPKGVEFLILGSARSLSTSQVASGAVRQSPIPIATGQAAGVAAALSVKKGITPAKIPAEDVRQELKRQGAVVD
jgi:FAD dependent oxidoreductase